MNSECLAHDVGEVDATRAVSNEAVRVKNKRELLRRLDHIQHLARHKEFDEIKRLLQTGYV